MSPTSPDWAVAELAARQHGVVARRQLRELGLGAGAIDHRVQGGHLHRVHRGVYVVGHPRLIGRARWMAAVLAGGPGSVLSHASAAALWELQPTARARVDVTVAGRRGRSRPGIALHRMRRPSDDDRGLRVGIPVTGIARTLLDLAEVASARQLARAVEEAQRLRPGSGRHLAALRTLLRASP